VNVIVHSLACLSLFHIDHKYLEKMLVGYKLFSRNRRNIGFRRVCVRDYCLRHVCPSIRMYKLGSHWPDFPGIC